MNDAHKEEMGENRMLLPAITTGVGVGHHSYPPPMQFELLPGQERPTTGGAATTTRHDAPKDAGLDLEPTAMAALRAALAGKGHVETAPGLPPSVARPEGVAPIPEWRADGRVPVLKTSTGAFLVGPTPQPSPQGHRSFSSRPVMPPRLMPNPPQPPSAHGAPHLRDQQLLFTTPEPRINVQSTARGAMPPVSKSPVSTYLVQASTGMYCIMSGGEATRSAEGRMMPMELKPHHHPHAHHHYHHHPQNHHQQHGLPMTQQSNATEARPMLPLPNPPSHPPMFAKAVKTSVSLTSKLQASALARPMQPQMQMQQQHQQQQRQQHHHHHHQQLSQKLLERPGNAAAAAAFMEPFSATGNLEAAAENLKSLFLSDNSHLPAPPLENLNFNPVPPQPFSDFFTERSTVSHKRRKTSTPASLDDLPPPSLSASQQAGLELLLQAAKTVGDTLPLNCDLHSRRSSYRKRTGDDRPSAPRLEYSLDPALRHCYGVLDNFTGVYPLVNGSFVARIRFKGCYALIGTFKTAEDAARAYDRVVLTFRGRKARTNYPYADYLTFELTNAKRAFEAKFKQCERTRRGSIWPWARAAHTLLANDEEGNDDVVPELGHPASPLTGTISGESVFELLQNVMLKRKDLNGTFDLIQAKIRQLQTRIQSGMSTEEECDCVGQYASAANILRSLVTMQNEWERKQNRKSGSRGVVLEERTPLRIHTDEDEDEEDEDEEDEDTTSETKQATVTHNIPS